MQWYIPITILPGVGLIILSTSNLLIALNEEIKELTHQRGKFSEVIAKKIIQLKKLNISLAGQYFSAFALVVSGISGVITDRQKLIIALASTAVIILGASIILLIEYSIKSIKIRQEHLNL